MEFLDLPRIEPTASVRALVASLYPRLADAPGSIGLEDAEMLLTLIEHGDARKIVEIGVASGASSLYILGMLNTLAGRRQLFAFDSQPRFYADESKPSGYLALGSEFNRDGRLVVNAEATALDLRSTIAAHAFDPAAPVDIGFIDANHRHPWPTIDFLLLLPLMRRGGVVVLHDINLPGRTGGSHGFGPRRLFSCPFAERFVVRGDQPNMGAIRVGDLSEMIGLARASLAKPWETELGPWMRKRLSEEIQSGGLSGHAGEIAPFFAAVR